LWRKLRLLFVTVGIRKQRQWLARQSVNSHVPIQCLDEPTCAQGRPPTLTTATFRRSGASKLFVRVREKKQRSAKLFGGRFLRALTLRIRPQLSFSQLMSAPTARARMTLYE